MIKRNRRYTRVGLLMVSLGIACGNWIIACAPTGDIGDDSGEADDTSVGSQMTYNSSSCEQIDEGNAFETTLTATSTHGRALSYSRRLTTAAAQDDSFQIATDVMADDELVMTVVTTSDAVGRIEVLVDYGPLVPGGQSADIVVENGIVSGVINGRAIEPMALEDADASLTSFADGAAAPDANIDPQLQADLEDLFAAAATVSESCEPMVSEDAETNNARVRQVLGIPQQDTGKDSDPEQTSGCIGCWAGCSSGAAACIGGVSGGCAATLIYYAVCEAIGVAACAGAYVGCVAGCNATGAPCCPVSCGAVACCLQEETCLNPDIGLCCAVGKTSCLGQTCCASDQTCIDYGPNAGICCAPADVCGYTCCNPTDSCIPAVSLCCPAGQEPCDDKCCPQGEICLGDGLCCLPEYACGQTCCDELDTCVESLSLCCGFDQPPCNGGCCNVGEECVNNACCPDARVCGGICCNPGSSCDQDTLTCVDCPNPTDNPCVVGGCCPQNTVCTDFEGICCPPGQLYCDGACRPGSECIK